MMKTSLPIYSLLFSALCCICSVSNADAQSTVQNALDFDGIDDEVVVANASALIANSNAISLSCWVLPRNANPQYPDFDGIAGFRDNTVSDFYLLQISATEIEARMRNSAGVGTDILMPGLTLNAWQHVALVYDGSTLSAYLNGILVGSAAASGMIASTSTAFRIGNAQFGFENFRLDGTVDDVNLWSKALTANEITCITQKGIDPNAADLALFYRCDQGVSGANNTGISSLVDAAGNIDGNLMGFTLLAGSPSNFVDGSSVSGSLRETICDGDVLLFNGQTITQAGIYSAIIPLGACDSIALLTVDVISIDNSVTQSGASLTAAQSAPVYQWLDCNAAMSPISGATMQTFSPTLNGSYAVMITNAQGCTDTSACFTVSPQSVPSIDAAIAFNIYPQPVRDFLFLQLGEVLGASRVAVLDLQGKTLLHSQLGPTRHQIDLNDLPSGIYLLRVESDGRSGVKRFVKR